MKVKAIAFDLDDTLIDTTGILVPLAAKQACEAMIANGLQCDLFACLQRRQQMAVDTPHREIFRRITQEFNGVNEKLTDIGIENFYNPPIPEKLNLLPGAEDLLQNLQERYSLYLVSSGVPSTQRRKLDVTHASGYFKQVFLMDAMKDEKKRDAFAEIIKKERLQPIELLSIGNRISQEIRQAKQLGSLTCYFAYGEHVGEPMTLPEDFPDFTVQNHQQILQTCRL